MNELTGGIRNALEHGEKLDKIKQSFVNAGYKRVDVDNAAMEISQLFSNGPEIGFEENSVLGKTSEHLQLPELPKQSPLQPRLLQSQMPVQVLESPKPSQSVKNKSRFLIYLIVIICVLILVAAGIFGLYFDELMNALFK